MQAFKILLMSLINSARIQLCSISSPSRQQWLLSAPSRDAPVLLLSTAQPRTHQAGTRSSGGSRELCGALTSPPGALPSNVGAFLLLHEPELPGQSEPCCIFIGARAPLGQALRDSCSCSAHRAGQGAALEGLLVLLLHPDDALGF